MLRNYLSSKSLVLVITLFVLIIDITRADNSQVILSAEEVKHLISKIEDAEKSLLNIKVESEAWMEESPSPSGPWERTPVHVTATSWFSELSKSKARVDVHSEISKVRDGNSGSYSYTEQNYTASYDGQFGKIIYHKYGNVGKPLYIKRGEVLSDAPRIFNGRRTGAVTGLRFTTNYFFADRPDRESFSQYFKIAISPEALEADAFEIVREEYNDIQCIKFSLKKSKSFRMTWWFDPSRGFALLKYENIRILENRSEMLDSRITIGKLKKIGDNIWWPVEGTIESDRRKSGEPYQRTVYRASKVVANDPNFDEAVFTVPFPDGYLIDDQVAGRKYTVGEEPNAPAK